MLFYNKQQTTNNKQQTINKQMQRMTTVTKYEMDMKAIETNNSFISLIVDFNNIIKCKEEGITQFKERKTQLLKNEPIPDINRKRKLNVIYGNSRKKDKIDGNLLNKKIKVIDEKYNAPDDYATNIEKNQITTDIIENASRWSSLTGSTVLECNINNDEGHPISSGKTKYKDILIDILKTMEPMEVKTILTKTDFNFKLTNEYGRDNYTWYACLNLSIQSKSSNETLTAIMEAVDSNNYTIQIYIRTKTGRIRYYDK